MTIDTTSGSVRGTTGCNDYFGEVTVEDTLLTVTGLGWTEIGCERPVMAQEAAILEVLQTVSRVSPSTATGSPSSAARAAPWSFAPAERRPTR